MKQCPFCKADIPADALKCRYCGEWVQRLGTLNAGFADPEESLGRAANRYVSFQMVGSVIGLIVFLLILFFFFLPMWRGFHNSFQAPSIQTHQVPLPSNFRP